MGKHEPNPAVVRAVIFEAVDNQIHDSNPPETQETLQRLIAEGHSREESRTLIANLVAREIFAVLKYHRPFDEARYVAALRRLPELPD